MSLELIGADGEPFSSGDRSRPVGAGIVIDIDGTGGTITTETIAAWVRATDYLYTACSLTPNDSAAVNWQISIDGEIWNESVLLPDLLPEQSIAVQLRCLVDNNGSVKPGNIDVAGIGVLGNEWNESAGPETYLHVLGESESQPFTVSDGAYFVLGV